MNHPRHFSCFHALRIILHIPGAPEPTESDNTDIVLLDYRDPDTFRALWLDGLESGELEIDSQKIDLTDSTKQFLLIGNDPPDGINFHSHFTATSWLAAWKVKFPDAATCIAVIDPSESGSAAGPAPALQTMLSARDASNQSLVPGAAALNAPNLEAICQWLKPVVPETRTLAKNAPHLRELLKSTIWNELTSNREQHHALSNVLGAFLLTRNADDSEDINAPKLLQTLVEALGLNLSGEKDSKSNSMWMPTDVAPAIPAVVLVDDMADLWRGFLDQATGRPVLTSTLGKFPDEVAGLPERLYKVVASGREFLCAADIFPHLAERGHFEDFVLFLDLRLHLGEAFRTMLSKFGWLLLQSKRNLPWIGPDRTQLEADLRLFATSPSSSPGDALSPEETLLPRLISLLDPTLPIVIFSSSHRSEMIDPFRDYGNIITAFRKPVLAGLTREWPTVVKEVRGDFESALSQASGILKARRMIKAVQSAGTDRESDKQPKAIEIFLDESIFTDVEKQVPGASPSKKSVLAVGAVVCVADTHDAIHQFCGRLEEKSLHWGLSRTNMASYVEETRWPWADSAGKKLECRRSWWIRDAPRDFSFLPKDADAPQIFKASEAVNKLAEKAGVRLFTASLRADPTDEDALAGRHQLSWDSVEADELHREITKRLLQMILVGQPEVAEALKVPGTSLAFDLGDRTHEIAGGRDQCEQFFQQFGIRYTDQSLVELSEREEADLRARHERNQGLRAWKPRAKAIAIDSDHAAFALREVIASLPNLLELRIERCRGVALMDFGDLQASVWGWLFRLQQFPAFPLQIHYLADWVARRAALCGIDGSGRASCLSPVSKGGFRQTWNARSRQLLEFLISGRSGARATAIAGIYRWTRENGSPQQGEKMLLGAAGFLTHGLRSDELKRLFASHDDETFPLNAS